MYYDYDRSHQVISYVFHNILRKCMRLSGLCESSQLMPCDIPFLQDSLEEQMPLRAIFPAQSHVRSLLKSSSPPPSFSRKLLSLVSLSLELAIWFRCLHWIIKSCLSMTRSIAHSFIASNIVSVLWIEAAISLCASAPPKPLSMTHFSAFSKCITNSWDNWLIMLALSRLLLSSSRVSVKLWSRLILSSDDDLDLSSSLTLQFISS